VTRFLEPIGGALSGLGVTPAVMTFVGLAVVVGGSVVIANGDLALGAAILLAGALLDGLDGAVARASNSVSARGAFLDAAFDRLGEIAAFAGLAVAKVGDARILFLIILSLGGAILVPYMRARAEAEGFDGRGGIMGRAERVILFSAGLIFGVVELMLWVFVVLVWLTAFSRFWRTYRDLA